MGASSDTADSSAKKKGSLGGKLAGMSLSKQIITIALWPFIEQVISFIVSASDLFYASLLGSNQAETIAITDGMGAVVYIVWMGFVVQGAIAMGSSAVVSHLVGAKKFYKANHAAGQALLLGFIGGSISCVLMYTTLDFLLATILELKPATQIYARQYMDIAAFTAPISGAVFALNGALRGSGDTKTPFLVILTVSVINVIFSALFVWGPPGIGGYGLSGIAAGTMVGFLVGLVFLIVHLERTRKKLFGRSEAGVRELSEHLKGQHEHYNPPLYLNIKDLKPDWKMHWRITRIGGPQAIEIFLIWAIQFYSVKVISNLPQVGSLGAHMIVIRVESMSFLPGFAVGTAASTLVGQYLGAKNTDAARQVVRKCAQYAMTFMGSIGMIFFIFPQLFLKIFASKSPELVDLSIAPLRVAALSQIAFAAAIVLKMSLRTAGDVKRVMLYSFGGIFFWRVVVLSVWKECSPETLDIFTIWLIFGADMLTQALIFWKIFRGNKWTTYKV